MIRLLALCLTLTAFIPPAAHADTGAPLNGKLSLTHVSRDAWLADYRLAEPVDSIELDPQVDDYRTQSWRILTPGVKLVKDASHEAISTGRPLSAFSIVLTLHLPYAQGNYTAFDRFSDGGTDVYLGFLTGDAMQGTVKRPLHLAIELKGLPGETVIPPDSRNPAEPDYAYFGPSRPMPFGVANVILDPALPPWLVSVMQDTTAKITARYDSAFGRKLRSKPLLLISVDATPIRGLSVKGGTFDNKIVYRFGGDALQRDTPVLRRMVTELIAHELAHIWQRNVERGGVGGEEMWVHEGGAEAIAVEGLKATGLFSPEDAAAYSTKLLKECEQLKDSVDTYRGFYACGYKRFHGYGTDIFALWKSMMETTEATGETYSSRMIQALLARSSPALH